MSGSILFLTTEDFNIQRGTKGDILCHGIPSFSLILFYSTRCDGCQTLIPIFKRLPGTINGCQFGMINVSANMGVVTMAKNTITPLVYVPYVVLYINGRPFMAYKGENDEKSIRDFIIDVANNVQKKQQFSPGKVGSDKNSQSAQGQSDSAIPAYCIGKPLSGNNQVCYLNFSTAYTPSGGGR